VQRLTSVLIVDGDDAFSAILKAGLSSGVCRCQVARSAEAAMEMMRRASFDVIVSDLALPGTDGLELTRCIRKVKNQLPVVVMTGRPEELPYDLAIEAGVSDFIVKPFAAAELALRVRHVVHQERIRISSLTDELTGLYNRWGFFTLVEQQLRLSRRERKGVYMLYADVDHLKQINDTWGHQEGDRALIETGRILKATYRQSDIIARIGGDEFVVIPISTNGDNIGKIIDRLRQKLEERNARNDLNYALSISVGVACYDPYQPCTIDELLAEGDRRMYEDKKARGRV